MYSYFFEKLRSELAAWEREWNTRSSKIRWHFTNNQAREKMASLYPKNEKIKYLILVEYVDVDLFSKYQRYTTLVPVHFSLVMFYQKLYNVSDQDKTELNRKK